VRLTDGGELVEWTDLLARCILGDHVFPYAWIANAVCSGVAIRRLVESCRQELPRLLRWIRAIPDFRISRGRPLVVQDVRRILKIVRNTDDPDLMIGALRVLASSTFVRIAGKNLLLKMILNDKSNDAEVDQIFGSYSRLEDGATQSATAARQVLKDVAREIVKDPLAFEFEVRGSAASYLVDHSPVKLPPMLSEETLLGLAI
jgi:hypothetical protein